MVKVSQSYMMNFKVPYLNNIDRQRQIVSEFETQMQVLSSLRTLKSATEKKIGKILADLWGVAFFESVNE